MNHTEIVNKLVGRINPIGVSEIDDERFENLKAMCQLVDELVIEIDNVATINHHAFSMKRSADYAKKFLTETLGIEQ